MTEIRIKPLSIGDISIPIPIVQGGMGVQVSTAPLVSAVSNYGGAGTIASVGLGYGQVDNDTDFLGASRRGLIEEIRKVKGMTDGIFGVNIMVALNNFVDLVRTTVQEGVDFIASGAGLPLRLPEYTEGSATKLIPIVSSSRAAHIIMRAWEKRYKVKPDAVIVEGPLAGGHLGFKADELRQNTCQSLEQIVSEVLEVVEDHTGRFEEPIPVIAAGGIYSGEDVAKFLRLGAKGVQMGTRFVATHECTITDEFKELYIRAKEEDVMIIDSPVGMPGRAIKTGLIDIIREEGKVPFKCNYLCLKTCNPKKVPYCIAQALFNAVSGLLDKAIVFAGQSVSRIKKVVSVKDLMDELVAETLEALAKAKCV